MQKYINDLSRNNFMISKFVKRMCLSIACKISGFGCVSMYKPEIFLEMESIPYKM